MGRLHFRSLALAVAILSLWSLAACGGGTKAGPPLFAGRINLTPTVNTSLVLGGTLTFSASAQTTSGTTLAVPITYSSSDTSVLNITSTGVACAGQWDAAFTSCTPGGTGVVQVTASALGSTSIPTYVFVHPPIDSITVSGVLLNGLPVQEPCLSQSQSMTLEAHAFSQGTDITASVGPFTWSENNPTVANVLPLVNSAYNFATNRATATAIVPGITQIYASASGVTSTSFRQPQYNNSQSQTSPPLDFFATCAIQSINLELNSVGSGQTSFVTSKGNSQTAFATLTDIMGASSLPNTTGGIQLTKVPLTWTSSEPGVIPIGTACTQSCASSLSTPGSATLTASCAPPTCNVGFPTIPATLASASQILACTQFFQQQYPQFAGCQELIPVPVYASTAVSGVVTGAPGTAAVLAGSTGCAQTAPDGCTSAVYYFSTSKPAAGSENALPTTPNSFLFTLAGDKIYMGSDFGAVIINPANFGTTTSPYSPLGTVTGKAIGVSNNGTVGVFSDTIHTPNQVYVVNASNASAPSATALTIPAATTATFTQNGVKTFIIGGANASSLYVFSTEQAVQGPIALAGPASAVAVSPNDAFAFVAEGAGSGSANLSAFAACNNQLAASLPLPANPLLMRVLPNTHLDGRDSFGNPIPDGIHIAILDSTGFDIVTATVSAPAAGTLCPQTIQFASGNPQRIELGEGTLQPVNFFASADGTQLYVLNQSSATIFVYDFILGSVAGGIPLLNNATPISASMTVDDGTILVAGSDNMLHIISTSLGGNDLDQVSFPNLPNALNAFCTTTPSAGPCTLDTAATR